MLYDPIPRQKSYFYLDASALSREHIDEQEQDFQEEEQTENTSEEDMMGSFFPPPPPVPWYLNLRGRMYSNDAQEVSSVLKENYYATITLLPEQKIMFNGKEIGREKLSELLLNNDILFLRFGKNLRHNDYLHAIHTIYDIGKKNNYNVAYPIELFSDLEAFLRENNIKL